MKPSSVLLAVAVACVLLVAGAAVPRAEASSRTGCIACTILLGLLEEGAIHVHSLGVRGTCEASLCISDASHRTPRVVEQRERTLVLPTWHIAMVTSCVRLS